MLSQITYKAMYISDKKIHIYSRMYGMHYAYDTCVWKFAKCVVFLYIYIYSIYVAILQIQIKTIPLGQYEKENKNYNSIVNHFLLATNKNTFFVSFFEIIHKKIIDGHCQYVSILCYFLNMSHVDLLDFLYRLRYFLDTC